MQSATHDATDRRPELPALDAGIHRLETDGRPTGALAALAVDAVLGGGDAVWVDARNHARTGPLVRVAPDPRILDRIRVARGFTPHQHYALVDRLDRTAGANTGLVVLPAVDAPYRGDELREAERTRLLVRALARLQGLARRRDLAVLATVSREDDLTAPVSAAATDRIRYETTAMGPRFVADGFETLVYPLDGGVQTTLAFWRRVLDARARTAGLDPAGSDTGPPDGETVVPGEVNAGGTH